MNSTTWNAAPEAAQQPETPIVEARPVPEVTDTSERVRAMHPGADLGWTNHGGMVEQQASAMEWVRASSQEQAAGDGERAATQEGSAAVEMTDSRQAAQYSRWTGEPLGETAGVTPDDGIGQSH
jgi:hypothetical protein